MAHAAGATFELVVDEHAIVVDGEEGFASLAFHLDLVGLPAEWRQAHIHLGLCLFVDAATLVVHAIKSGRILDYSGKPNRKMCSLYLSMMDKIGIRLDRFGDSNQRLAEL